MRSITHDPYMSVCVCVSECFDTGILCLRISRGGGHCGRREGGREGGAGIVRTIKRSMRVCNVGKGNVKVREADWMWWRECLFVCLSVCASVWGHVKLGGRCLSRRVLRVSSSQCHKSSFVSRKRKSQNSHTWHHSCVLREQTDWQAKTYWLENIVSQNCPL